MAINKTEAARLLGEISERVQLIRELIRQGSNSASHEDQAFYAEFLAVETNVVHLRKRCER